MPEDPARSPIALSLVLTTEADRERGEALAGALLERGLVACASLYPVVSHYRWKGRLERAEEVQLLLKTSPEHLDGLLAALTELHSYETPEWIHWKAGSAGAYGGWLLEQLALAPVQPPLSPDGRPPAPEAKPGSGAPAG
jgi:periplasmic divalent cation tolerance protein